MLYDAFNNRCDNALLVSGDTDLIGPLSVIKQKQKAEMGKDHRGAQCGWGHGIKQVATCRLCRQ